MLPYQFLNKIIVILCWSLVFSQSSNIPAGNINSLSKKTNLPKTTGVPNTAGKEQVMSLVIGGEETTPTSFIQLISPPDVVQHRQMLLVDYKCNSEGYVGVEMRVWTDISQDVPIFHEFWTCSPHAVKPLRKRVQLFFPDSIAFKPSLINPKVNVIIKSTIRLWIVEKTKFKNTDRFIYNKAYNIASVKSLYDTTIKNPMEREEKQMENCIDWSLTWRLKLPYTPICEKEILVENVISFPVALSGNKYGVVRSFLKQKDPILEALRKRSRKQPEFTVVIYVYLTRYCTHGLCSIMQKLTWDDRYMTPLVFINEKGKLHVQIATTDNRPMAFITNDFYIRLKTWTRLIVRCKKQKFEIAANWGPKWNESFSTWYKFGSMDTVYFDDVAGIFVFGGSDLTSSIHGYIGEVLYYRTRAVDTENIPFVPDSHLMFELELSESEVVCKEYNLWLQYRIWQCRQLLRDVMQHHTCPYFFEDVFYAKAKKSFVIPQCAIYGGTKPDQYKHVNTLVRRLTLKHKTVSKKTVGEHLYKDSLSILEVKGLNAVKDVIPLLKQASCYNNHDASFLLSAIYSKGIAVKTKELEAVSYLMLGALANNRLCLMALGNKHVFGLDGVQKDDEIAYRYYKSVADKTKFDREKHAEEDIFTEAVRLTDEYAIEAQTDEEGDLFQWFKHQASQGMVHAQRNMGRMLFWGAQGVRRDLRGAAEYYRLGAENGDPQSMHDYGLVLLKGQGVEKNETAAVHWLKLSAEKGHISALNALGWYALERTGNKTEALLYFNESYQNGNADAAHNIGHMLQYGRMPDGKVDKVNCFTYFAFAAARGQLDSAIQVAHSNMRGHPLTDGRNAYIAMDWARFVSEQNPAMGNILSKGLKAYSNKQWETALLYYIMAAESGTEVGNFNLAYLCEENNEGTNALVEKECQWTHFNLSTKRYEHQVDPYAFIKMGDYHWYGCKGARDVVKAAEYYTSAAVRGDPHALFNLGFLVEEGVRVPYDQWIKLQIPKDIYMNNITLLYELYSRCSDSYKSEAYVPCSIAYYRVQMVDFWQKFHLLVKLSTFLGAIMVVFAVFSSVQSYVRLRQQNPDTV